MPICRFDLFLHFPIQTLPELMPLLMARIHLLHLPLPEVTLIRHHQQLLQRRLWLQCLQVATGNCSWLR